MSVLVQVGTPAPVAPVVPSHAVLKPLGIGEVTITDGFWAQRQRLNRVTSIPHALRWVEKLNWVGNFVSASRNGTAQRAGREFSDSDVYKLVEAMVWEEARSGDEELETAIRRLSAVISSAQAPDGYLNTHFGQAGLPARYSDFEWGHELYCYGHLFQAGAARIRCGHHDALVETAVRAADHVVRVFGDGGMSALCGHPGVEMGLAELGRATGCPEYLEQARLFIDRRGTGLLGPVEWGQEYFQDDLPIREATVFRGHAVRAGYLAAGAVDVASETGDYELLAAIQGQYDRTLARRTYVTGGMGSRHSGEAFGEDFELPPDRAYCETCAAVASVMVAWRLLLATGQEKYGDTIERTLYNAIACSPSASGDAFFYANPLHVRKAGTIPDTDKAYSRAESTARAPWFTVSCCPPNLARLFASLSAYLASVEGNRIRIHQFASGEISALLASGGTVRLGVRTNYPSGGLIRVTVLDCNPADEWSLALRIPSWAKIRLEGLAQEQGLAVASGRFAPGDSFTMEIDMTPRLVYPDPRIDANRGCVAVERGPLVLCLESTSLPNGFGADDFALDTDAPLEAAGKGVIASGQLRRLAERAWPYGRTPASAIRTPTSALLTPYHQWGNRGLGTMRVWLPTAQSDA
jgi:DUF1680 family protein